MFAIDLPMVTPTTLQQETHLALESDSSGKSSRSLIGKTILVVDDEESILVAIRLLLEQWHCEVLVASSGSDALAKLKQHAHAPHLIICDDNLSANKSSIELIDTLQKEFSHPIPALIITGTLTPERLHEISATGIPVLHKPVSAEDLYEMILPLVE
jgi:CheY-like chemotaxis protein